MSEQDPSPQAAGIPPERRSWPRRMLNRMEVDRAVFYALVLRGWQLLGGVVSVLLIARFFTKEVQDYYYVFASLMGLQAFFELGFSTVIINIASHEWAELEIAPDGRVVGSAASQGRLASLYRLLLQWYGAASVLFVLAVGIGGGLFLAQRGTELPWQSPWAGLVVLTGILLWTLPFNAFLEGCGQVATVNRFRVVQAVSANVVIWVSLVLGAGLWVAVAGTAMRVLVDLYLLGVHYGRFFGSLRTPLSEESVAWRSEVWPLQWRRGVTGVTGYFAFFLFTPVMFHYHSAGTAGRMGMTWALVTTLQAAALAWVQTRVPRFGELIARREFAELDRIFFRLTGISLCVIGLGSAGLWGIVYGLNLLEYQFAERLLPLWPTAIFLLAVTLYQIPHCQEFYIRAHKRDPLMPLRVAGNLATGGLVWLLGKEYGPAGAGAAYLGVVVVLIVPGLSLIWSRCRREWHEELRVEN